jgi:toxin HigB-1
MIISFFDKETELIRNGYYSKKFPTNIQKTARRKLLQIDSAILLKDLSVPPGNKLHALTDDRKGQYSISINDQYRICFNWENGNALNVEITDYH